MQLIQERLRRLDSPPDMGLGERAKAQASVFFTRPFLALHLATELYTSRLVLALALSLGWESRLRQGATLDELIEGFAPQSRNAAEWMLPFLAEEGLLRQDGGRYFLEGEPELDLAGIRAFTETEAPGHGANFELLDAVLRQVKPYFTEGKSGEQLLFDLTVFPLWLSFFRNENLNYYPNNLFTLIAFREGLPPGARVLELGGGVGSFAQLLARDGAEAGYLDRIAEYRFTDIAPAFLRKAQRDLREKAPGLPFTFGAFDINKPFEGQNSGDGLFDVIVGVNVLHVAVDLQAVLRRLRSMLKPGGRLVIGECMKPDLARPIYNEFFFKFMKGFTEVELDPELRPCSGFLTPEAWEKALLAAGFSRIRKVPDIRAVMKVCPTFYVGALAAEA
ncbi:MAG: methyltransferase [Holophagaceae bacterium]|nr:methyltransferase [Holophagaceae bacterium]